MIAEFAKKIFKERFILFILLTTMVSGNPTRKPHPGLLYVWAGQDPTLPGARDRVVVIDFTETSPTYGMVISQSPVPVDVPNVVPSGNEPHHSGVSLDGRWFVSGGLLSFASSSHQIFVWSIDPQAPRQGPTFQYGLTPPGGCTDEFVALGASGFLVSQMCSDTAGDPGKLLMMDAATRSVVSLTDGMVLPGFNPHGFGLSRDFSLLASTDYILPGTLLGSDPDSIVFRSTVRIFDLTLSKFDKHSTPNASLSNPRTFNLPVEGPHVSGQVGTGNGFMDLRFIPNDPQRRAYTMGGNDEFLYLIHPVTGGRKVFDLRTAALDRGYHFSACIVFINEEGTRLFGALQLRYLLMFDIRDPVHPELLQVFDFCTDPSLSGYPLPVFGQPGVTTTFSQFCAENGNQVGAHYVKVYDNRRIVVANYFLKFGLSQSGATHTLHSFKLNPSLTHFEFDPSFDPNPQLAAESLVPHSFQHLCLRPDGSLDHPSGVHQVYNYGGGRWGG